MFVFLDDFCSGDVVRNRIYDSERLVAVVCADYGLLYRLEFAFNIPTREVGYQYYVLMASFSYLIPLIFGILVNLRIKKYRSTS